MVSRREALQEALSVWRSADRELAASGASRQDLQLKVDSLRDNYQRLYTEGMVDNLDRLQNADLRRSRSTPSTPAFHEATRDTQEIAADIWEQARRGDRDTTNGSGDNRDPDGSPHQDGHAPEAREERR